jgi:Lrp/AsnC family transcriptional regulator, leucine-responsive regulatory protein
VLGTTQRIRGTSVKSAAIDAIDRKIIGLLVKDARMSYRELGERVSLSANAAGERVRRLRERGVIAGFHAVLDPAAAGRQLVVLIDVRLARAADAERFERLVESLPEVTDAAPVTGRFDYLLRAACRDSGDLDSLIKTLKSRGGVVEADTRIALRTVVERPASLARD